MGSSPHLWFCACKTATLGLWITSLCGSKTLTCGFCMQNSDFRTRITSLLWVPVMTCVILCLYDSVISTRMQDYMGSSPHLWFCACQNSDLYDHNCLCLWVPDFTCDFLHAKERALCIKITSLYGIPALICSFVHGKQRLSDPNSKSLWVSTTYHLQFCASNAVWLLHQN